MVKMYINPDIPKDYKYISLTSNYVDLYNKPYIHDERVNFYRIYYPYNDDVYEKKTVDVSKYTTLQPFEIERTNNFLFRRDADIILIAVFFFTLLFIFLINIATSLIKRGGIFGA